LPKAEDEYQDFAPWLQGRRVDFSLKIDG